MPDITREDLEQAKTGDLSAFERILEAFEKPIFNYAYRLLGNYETAEDATQETFIKFYRSLSRLDVSKPFSPWLYAIATNTAYDILRKKKYMVEVGLQEAEQLPAETEIGEDPYYQTARQFDAELVQQHLSRLKPAQRSAILMYYYQNLSIEEISRAIGLPPGTIKTHLYRGRNELKNLIEKTYED